MQHITQYPSLEPYVKEILFLENKDDKLTIKLPFYADGYPGIIYSESFHPFYLQPRNKELSNFYLYGQTIKPIELQVQGSYRLIALRLYPFAVRLLLGVKPKVLNEDCYDLLQLKDIDTSTTVSRLQGSKSTDDQLAILTEYFHQLIKVASVHTDYRIKLALNLIISANGVITVKELREQLFIAERTFERQFTKEVGVSPKQFAKIIQFSSSMRQITEEDYLNLTAIGLENGFADQSHFIRAFKRYTGKTPTEFQKQLSA